MLLFDFCDVLIVICVKVEIYNYNFLVCSILWMIGEIFYWMMVNLLYKKSCYYVLFVFKIVNNYLFVWFII